MTQKKPRKTVNIYYFCGFFFSFILLYLSLALKDAKKITDNKDYFLAGRSVGFLPLCFTLVATQLGGGMVLGSSSEAYLSGYYGILYSAGICLGFLALALFFGPKLRSMDISTTVELFEKRYQSNRLKKIASLLSILSMSGLLVAQVVGSRQFLIGIGFEHEAIFLAFWCFIVIYTALGGIQAVIMMDAFQIIYVFLIFSLIFALQWQSYALPTAAQVSIFSQPSVSWTSLLLMPFCFSLIEQDLAQRCFSAKSTGTVRKACLLAAFILLLFSFIPVYLGMQAKLAGVTASNGASPLLVYLRSELSELLFAMLSIGLLAAITSTADSLLCAISSNLAQDFSKTLSQKTQLQVSRLCTLFIGLLAIILGIYYDNILSVLVASYELPVSCLFVSLMYCFFTEGTLSKRAAISSVSFGLLSFILFHIYPSKVPSSIASLACSFIGYQLANK